MSSMYVDLPTYGSTTWLSPVASAVDLPSGAQIGDAVVTEDTSIIYIYNGTSWVISGNGSGTYLLLNGGNSPLAQIDWGNQNLIDVNNLSVNTSETIGTNTSASGGTHSGTLTVAGMTFGYLSASADLVSSSQNISSLNGRVLYVTTYPNLYLGTPASGISAGAITVTPGNSNTASNNAAQVTVQGGGNYGSGTASSVQITGGRNLGSGSSGTIFLRPGYTSTSPGPSKSGSLVLQSNGVNGTGYSGAYSALTIDGYANVVLGPVGSAQDVLLSTGATSGFLYLKSMNGAPTGTPAATFTGSLPFVYDSVDNKLYSYVSGSWVSLTPSLSSLFPPTSNLSMGGYSLTNLSADVFGGPSTNGSWQIVRDSGLNLDIQQLISGTWTTYASFNSDVLPSGGFADAVSSSWGLGGNVSYGTSFTPSAGFTYSAWIKPTPYNNFQSVVCYGTAYASGSACIGTYGSYGFYFIIDGQQITAPQLPNVWQHVVGTYNASTNVMTLYVNGVQQASTSHTMASAPGNQFRLGGDGSTLSLYGLLDDVSVWPVSLTSGQVAELYNNGLPNNITTTSFYGSSGFASSANALWVTFEGNSWNDVSHNGYTGTYNGGGSFSTHTPATDALGQFLNIKVTPTVPSISIGSYTPFSIAEDSNSNLLITSDQQNHGFSILIGTTGVSPAGQGDVTIGASATPSAYSTTVGTNAGGVYSAFASHFGKSAGSGTYSTGLVALGYGAAFNQNYVGTGNIAIGYNALLISDGSSANNNTCEIGTGTATLKGGMNFCGNPVIDSDGALVVVNQAVTPAKLPPTGMTKLYVKSSDGKLYRLNSSGVETLIG